MKYLKQFANQSDYQAFKESEDYILPNVSFVVENKSVEFEPKKHVVFIQHVDGNLYTPAQWTGNSFSNDLANGVAVVTDAASFVIAKDEFAKVKWQPSSSDFINGVSYINDSVSPGSTDYSSYIPTARTILNGYNDTNLIIATTNEGAAVECYNYVFQNGNRGYLPAIGELLIVSDYINDINDALSIIGGAAFGNTYYFSTTQNSYKTNNYYGSAWTCWLKSGAIYPQSKTSVNYINTRPFTTI
jgi:hypothetical protein